MAIVWKFRITRSWGRRFGSSRRGRLLKFRFPIWISTQLREKIAVAACDSPHKRNKINPRQLRHAAPATFGTGRLSTISSAPLKSRHSFDQLPQWTDTRTTWSDPSPSISTFEAGKHSLRADQDLLTSQFLAIEPLSGQQYGGWGCHFNVCKSRWAVADHVSNQPQRRNRKSALFYPALKFAFMAIMGDVGKDQCVHTSLQVTMVWMDVDGDGAF